MSEMLIPYALAAWIAGFIAFGELTSRYHVLSLPHGARSGAVWAYLLVNAGAGIAGTALVQAFAPGLGPFASSFIGAFGALMFLRSSVMSVRNGTIEVPIGPAGILSLLLATADRAIDRSSAEEVGELGRLLQSMPFARIAESLPRYLLEHSTPPRGATETRDIRDQAEFLSASPLPDPIKSLHLASLLSRYFGPDDVRRAVHAIWKADSAASGEQQQLDQAQADAALLTPRDAAQREFWDSLTREAFEKIIQNTRIEQRKLLDEFPDRAAARAAVQKLIDNGLIIRGRGIEPEERTLLPTAKGLAEARELDIESPGPLEAIRSLAGG